MSINTYPLCHVQTEEPWRSLLWIKELNKCGINLPMFIVHDLGHLLLYSKDSLKIKPPEFFQNKINTSAYIDVLNFICSNRIIRDVVNRTLSHSIIGAIIAKLVKGISFPELQKSKQNQLNLMKLEHDLKTKSQSQIWKSMDPSLRAMPDKYLSSEILAKIPINLQNLHEEEISFLIIFGPQIWGHGDISQIMDIFSFMDLPWSGQHILSQMLRLIPIVQTSANRKGGQVYPMGGYEGISNKGEIDNLIPSEFCYDKDMLTHRILNNESLYYSRESMPKKEKELALIITQTSLDMKGDADILARGLTLALWHQLKQRGFDVYQCFIGQTFTHPIALNSIKDISKIVYYKDPEYQHPESMLTKIIETIKQYGENYPQRHLYWLLSEHWDADLHDRHFQHYDQINQNTSSNQAWFIQTWNTSRKAPKVCKYFSEYQIITNEILSKADIMSHIPTVEENQEFVSRMQKQEQPVDSFENTLGMSFVLIPAGVFMMGSPEDEPERFDREVLHEVSLTQPYYMQTTQVTQSQWEKVMRNNPSHFKEEGSNCPVERVSWEDAQEFIKQLNTLEGTEKYRLPTEAEWEHACRAGTGSAYVWGDEPDCSRANYGNGYSKECKDTNPGRTTQVESYPPNSWGLYDMHGNVWEWCQDWFGDYPTRSVKDPTGPEEGASRVLRGGSWVSVAGLCRSACRGRGRPADRDDFTGFRLVCSPGQQE
ncbi:Sulphatase-modifying factor domain protein [Candidatus Magnetomorum sp. HK-1]|nr:Sulphatase-modifying factor domain protein [Candidatus Magnetomorum sp. HK-1]